MHDKFNKLLSKEYMHVKSDDDKKNIPLQHLKNIVLHASRLVKG